MNGLAAGAGDEPVHAPEPSRDRAQERLLLGDALDRRSIEVLRHCQHSYEKQSGTTAEEVASVALWEILSIAVGSIVNWLRTGRTADNDDRSRIASLGAAVAAQQVVTATSEPLSAVPTPSVPPDSRNRATDQLSVTLLTKLNLWWSAKTCAVLTEEADRLGISRETLDEATTVVVNSCNSSLVRMAKQYDAELASLHQQLSHLAMHDPLTGLSNRTVFLDRLDRALAGLARRSAGLALVFMDLDNFKSVNDTHGHKFGDEVLIEAANRMAQQGRAEDLVARLSGDEFVALFEHLTDPMREGRLLAERLRSNVAAPMSVQGKDLHMTVSVGVAIVREPGCRAEEVMAQADLALYAVKRVGRNRVIAVEVGGAP